MSVPDIKYLGLQTYLLLIITLLRRLPINPSIDIFLECTICSSRRRLLLRSVDLKKSFDYIRIHCSHCLQESIVRMA